MIHVLVYYAIALATCWFAFRHGGFPERIVAAAFLLAAILSSLLAFTARPAFRSVDTALLSIDLALLAGLVAVALFANRFWPIWVSALHLLAIAVHGVRAYDPDLVPWMYAAAISKIAYPMLALLVVGTERHRRRRGSHGCDPDWSSGSRSP
ncbi:hypothetical protein U1763_15155 [Sphingomonas sp. LB2R24]|uniref:hypothetical protein n=1 Tax=Sphingomonas sorbitolis TaxID=3096165 RepID=UPI002FC65B95